jgi:hypothetical protein
MHVDEASGNSVIESHSGVGVRPIQQYLAETKLRIMVLRLRRSAVAGGRSVAAARGGSAHWRRWPGTSYDFAMNYNDPPKQFCSKLSPLPTSHLV